MVRLRSWLYRTTLATIIVARSAHAQAADPTLTAHIDSIYARYTGKVPGCAVGIYQDGNVTFAKGYGIANMEYDIPITPTTPFIVGSVTKQFTAAAIALLAGEKRISLDDDVRKYIPELHDYGKRVTINQLVHHTSGLRDWWQLVDLAGMRYDDTYSVQDVLDMTSRQRSLNFVPDERYMYSNTGYILLGVVVQRVTGKSLREFAAERFFTPLGMADTHFHDDHREQVRGRAYAYHSSGDGKYLINVWNNEIVGQGGLMTTVMDLQKWDENFYTGQVGGPAFLRQMLEEGKVKPDSLRSYAFGLTVGTYRGLPVVEHLGASGGYRAVITRFPSKHTTFTSLCNSDGALPDTLARRMADYVLRADLSAPATLAGKAPVRTSDTKRAASVMPSARELDRLTGSYYSPELDATYVVTRSGATLMLTRPRASAVALMARDANTFVLDSNILVFGKDGRSFAISGDRAVNVTFVRR